MQNVEIGVVWGLSVTQGHRQRHHSIEHTNSYSTLIETVHLSCTVFGL